MTPITLTRHGEISALLADARFDVVAAPPATRGLAWLRGAVSRFSRAAAHDHRRRTAAEALVAVRPTDLRAAAASLAGEHERRPRDVPLIVLARALGARRPVLDQVAMLTPGYFGRTEATTEATSEADDLVEDLIDTFGGGYDEVTAGRIGLLVQAHDATGRLVENALTAVQRWGPGTSTAAAVAETLRHDPPVPMLRRECLVDHDGPGGQTIPAGSVIILDVAAANRDPIVFASPDRFDPTRPNLDQVLTFGTGLRPCPGRSHAMALAIGTIEGVLDRDR
jgi:hypothetical protein